MDKYIPKWHRELEVFSKVDSVLVLEGNIFDMYRYPINGSVPEGSFLQLPEYLHYWFKDTGYHNIVFYDSIRGFHNEYETGYIEKFAELLNEDIEDGHIITAFSGRNARAVEHVWTALTQDEQATVIVMDFASRYIVSPDSMIQAEIDSYTRLTQAALGSREVFADGSSLRNLLILTVNCAGDLPTWFYQDNPKVKNILIQTPSREERELLIKGDSFSSFFDREVYCNEEEYFKRNPNELTRIQNRFVALTEGFAFTELNSIRRLSKERHLPISKLCDAVDLYRFGIKDNPWSSLEHRDSSELREIFHRRVKGQEPAVTRTLDVIKRAATGLSGLQSSSGTKPRGVLFFAGPTGTGKTETAKTLAEALFGDESRCIRFDMSEYGQPHSDQKLLGAPPGYVGYEAGGQLTNAVKREPFSVLLFDEIEKAHPSIMDKFLQILEDGRMTDGQGNTVYFSETVIIFTSNLGIYDINEFGHRSLKVIPGMEYEDVQKSVRKGIDDYFKLQLGRPELLNRIGENIVVFDFIREDVAGEILQSQLNKVIGRLQSDRDIAIEVSDTARKVLLANVLANLENGGRGIGNVVESLFINPLARYLFDNHIGAGNRIRVGRIDDSRQPYSMKCKIVN